MNEKEDSENLQKPVLELSAISEDEKAFKGVIRWNVSNSEIQKRLEHVGKYMKSDMFSIGSPSYCSFYFFLYPNGKNSSSERFVSVSIQFNRKLPEGAWIKGIIYVDGLTTMKEFSVCGKDTDGRIDFDAFCCTSDLKNRIRLNDLDHTLHCSLEIKVKEVKCIIDKETVQYVQNRNYDSCKESLKREFFSDITITVDDHEFKAHKAVLAKIPYFQMLFDVGESKEHVELTNIRYITFAHVLDFLYTGDIPRFHFKLACELYIVASDLKIYDLKNMCSSYLGSNLTETNVFVLVKLSHEYDDIALKRECIKFIQNSDVETLAVKSILL